MLPGRRKSIAFFIAMGAALILVLLLLYIGWVLLRWRTGSLLFLGVLLLTLVIGGVVANTVFLVRGISELSLVLSGRPPSRRLQHRLTLARFSVLIRRLRSKPLICC